MSEKIIGVTVGTQLPKPDFNQTDPTKGDYIKNKPAAVLYTEQTLTDEQKSQARANIGMDTVIFTTVTNTPNEVVAATVTGQPYVVYYNDNVFGVIIFSNFTCASDLGIIFSSACVLYSNMWIVVELIGSLSSNTWELKFTQVAEKTDIPTKLPNPQEIEFAAGQNIFLYEEGHYLNPRYTGDSKQTIYIPTKTSHLENDSGFVTSDPSVFYVDITCSGDVSSKESYSTDVTMEALSAAYNAGRPIYARVNSFFFSLIDGYDETSFSLIFCGVSISFLNNIDDNKYVCSSILPVRTANPHALTINGTQYDGSEEISIDVGIDAVLYTAQELTDEQKLQARENIGVNYTIDDALAILAETSTAVPVQDEDGNILTDENGNVIIL